MFRKLDGENFKECKERKKGQPVRFLYDEKIPADLLNFIVKKMKIRKEESLIPADVIITSKISSTFRMSGELVCAITFRIRLNIQN